MSTASWWLQMVLQALAPGSTVLGLPELHTAAVVGLPVLALLDHWLMVNFSLMVQMLLALTNSKLPLTLLQLDQPLDSMAFNT